MEKINDQVYILHTKIKGIRILDKIDRVVCVNLVDILTEISYGNSLYWSILFLQARGNLGKGISIVGFQNRLNKSERGLNIKWDELNILSHKFEEIEHIILIACKNKDQLHRYKEDQEMYETCDIVIEFFDSSFWEVFSKDEQLIKRLASKFKKVEHIESDFIH